MDVSPTSGDVSGAEDKEFGVEEGVSDNGILFANRTFEHKSLL